jgi:hypothetical protein
LGNRESFSGGFLITPEPYIFGPHERPFTMPMMHHTGYEPVAARHILDAALCGTCHTLVLTDSTGRVTLPEQTTYLEWIASEYPKSKTTCQTCHVPAVRSADGRPAFEYIAHRPPGGPFPPTRPRSPIGLHSFVGGNVQMLRSLASTAESAGFLDQATATSRFLRSAVALHVATPRTTGHRLIVSVTIRNLSGHKLPTGLPGRRLWIHLTASDRRDRVIFESGAWDHDTGELKHAQSFATHRDTVARSHQTAIYEAVVEDTRGDLTDLLTQAVRYRKDNRLLPAGFNRMALPQEIAAEWIAPVGTGSDPDFTAGQDTVRYSIPVPKSSGPIRISAEACFQSIRPASAAAIPGLHRGPEVIGKAEIVAGGGEGEWRRGQ